MNRSIIPIAVFALAFIALPLILSSLWIKVVTSAAIFAIAAAGISVLFAQLGLINLSQIALIGVGGWVALRLNYGTSLPFSFLVLIAGVVTAAIGAVLAFPALRMRGLYLALVTLMAAGAFQIFFNAFQFPNGGEGFWGVARQSAEEIRRPVFAQTGTMFWAAGFAPN